MVINRVVLALGILGVASVGAMAADMPMKAPPMVAPLPPPVYSWTGCYIGVNVGWIGNASGDVFTHPGPPSSFGGQDFNPSPNSHTYDGGSDFIGGGQVGCNYQINQFVLGVEADISGTGFDWTETASYPAIAQTAPAATNWTAHSETVSSSIPWLATFRGRVGWAFDRWMIYGTGGLAVGRVDASLDYNSSTAAFRLTGSDSETRTGWTLGGGVEWAFYNNWSLKAEYLYVDLGSFSFLAPNVVPGGGDTRTWAVDVDTKVHIVRVGLNYRF
jgi:outer membrane immunogenic protein